MSKKTPRSKATKTTARRATTTPPAVTKAAVSKAKTKAATAAVEMPVMKSTVVETAAKASFVEKKAAEKPVVATPIIETPAAAVPAVVAPAAEAIVETPATPVIEAAVIAAPVVEAIAAPTVDIAALAADLRNAWAETAADAAERLAACGHPAAAAPLIEAVLNADGYYHVVTRASAAMALGNLGHATDAVVETLLTATRDNDAAVSAEAILSLGQLTVTAAAATLIEIVENANGFYAGSVRHAALRALGRLGDRSAREAVLAVADNTWEDAALRNAANQALAGL